MPPTIKTYQVSWVDNYRIELPLPPTWEEKGKGRAKEEPQSSSLEYVTSDQKNLFYQPPRLICVDCGKKLFTMGTCIGNNKEWPITTKYYCRLCLLEKFGQLKQQGKILFLITELLEPKKEVLITENMLFQDPTENTKTEQYLVYSNLSKKLELKWYSDNEEGICPEKVHDTNAAPHSFVKIDLKIVLEILVSTMVQVVSRSSLAKKGIDIKGKIINAGYMGNIIVMLQNNSNRPYKIESQEKIAQAIFLPLASLPEKSMVNFSEEDSDQINQKIQDQALLFEASPKICSLANVANLYLPAKAHKHFKISIHNLTKNVIEISERTLIGSISADIQNSEKTQFIPNFAQLFLFCDITSQVWNFPKESYLFTPEEINKLNLGNLSILQQIQLKVLLNQYVDVFASENEFGCTDIVKHQIDTGDARPIKQ
ncbi:hypothetical protein G9A89_022656 [Geosiphon pyriformis]|nr:hypothetical protein G9A89_022656 [Geosiphon pyriformis]